MLFELCLKGQSCEIKRIKSRTIKAEGKANAKVCRYKNVLRKGKADSVVWLEEQKEMRLERKDESRRQRVLMLF